MLSAIKRTVGSLLLVAAVIGGVGLLAGCQKEQTWKLGASAPEMSVLDLHDKTVKLSDFKGKVVVVRFWASGCKACIEGMPAMDKFSNKYKERGLAVLAVNMGNSKEFVQAFAQGLHISYPMLLDPALIASKKYAVRAVPTTFFIDRHGLAKKVVLGEVTREVFDETVAGLL